MRVAVSRRVDSAVAMPSVMAAVNRDRSGMATPAVMVFVASMATVGLCRRRGVAVGAPMVMMMAAPMMGGRGRGGR